MIRSLSINGRLLCDTQGEVKLVEDWCIANLSDVSGFGITANLNRDGVAYSFFVSGTFANDEDAMLFKMRWEGAR